MLCLKMCIKNCQSMFHPKNLVQKYLEHKINWVQKILGLKKIWVQKDVVPQKMGQNDLSLKNWSELG